MHDHAGHTKGMPEKPEAPKPSPANPDPHAGHEMEKPRIQESPRKGAGKK